MKTERYTNSATAICEECVAEIKLTKREKRRQYRFQRFCSRRCSKLGKHNPQWKGDAASRAAGHYRAQTRFALGQCSKCGKPAVDRHHKDDNALHNNRINVESLCRRCHMVEDGRLGRLSALGRKVGSLGRAAASAARLGRTHCKSGHPYTPDNVYISSAGARVCRKCNSLHRRTYHRRSYAEMKEHLNVKRREKYAAKRMLTHGGRQAKRSEAE